MDICSIDGCSKKRVARGFCPHHYYIAIRDKKIKLSPQAPQSPRGLSITEKIDHYTRKGEHCWEWMAYKNKKGYGQMFILGKTRLVHRFILSLKVGVIPDGLQACHHCDNPSCVNPDHLFLGTNQDNVDDKHAKGRQRYIYGEQVTTSKLKERDVLEIRKLIAKNELSIINISALYNVSSGCIRNIKSGYSWGWLG